RVLGAKADGKYVEQIEGINLEEKDLKIVLEDQFVNCEGIVKLELNVVSSETEITTKEFYFFVSNTMNAEIIDSADSIPTLEKVSKYVDDAVNNLDSLKEASEDITIINSEFKEAEIKRKANELLRERSEKERVRLESIRTTEEADRIKAETSRVEAENKRKVAESNRKLAENTRKTNEAARVEAELNRQSLFEENEEIRNENENLRIASEKERIKFNSEAKTDELNRKEAEKNRVLAEEERKSSEESRVAAEAIRQNTYTDFNESEEERKNNEIKRQEAEALRVEAETIRDNLFSEKEEERNASFIESEKVRNAAFNKTQDSRNTVFEESETVREEAFKISEKARNDAEELRVTAESERVKSEKLRVDSEKARVLAEEERNTTFTQKEEERNNTFTQNETNRNDTFTQSEEERKATFEEAENARKVAESKRVKAESSRVEAEKLRVTAETGRVEAENLRATAEEERVAAETKREEGFNKFDSKINANTKELKAARTATTGEKFNSLDERIDCEVDRLNKKIDVTMLQQEDKGSHLVENTVEGMTTDMVIKGRTLQNIHPKATYKFATNYSPSNFEKNEGENSCEITLKAKEECKYCFISAGQVYFPLLEPNTKYTIIANATDGLMPEIMTPSYTHSLTTHKVAFKNGVATFTTNDLSAGANGQVLYIPINVDLINVKQYIKNAMIIKGDLSHSLDYFEGIKSFGQQEDKISILSNNKNLFKSYEELISVKKGQQLYLSSKLTDGCTRIDIQIDNQTDITVSDIMYWREAEKVYRLSSDRNKLGISLAVNRDCNIKLTNKYLKVKEYEDIKLEEGTQATQYEYYKCNKKDILLSEYGFKDGLKSVNDTVFDGLNSTRNIAIKKVDKHTFTGNEDWRIMSESNNEYIYFEVNFNAKKSDKINIICNNFIARSFSELYAKNTNGISAWSDSTRGTIFIGIEKSKLTSLNTDGFKTWLKANPTTIYYELAEPVETPLSENINLKTFDEKTYVSFENNISGTSSFKAYYFSLE
ncbi:MAG: hypothetical protein E6303_05785, partial [Clostridium perfringens]|nr:hypothetical protein [Clostridium perfringens]